MEQGIGQVVWEWCMTDDIIRVGKGIDDKIQRSPKYPVLSIVWEW